MFVRGSVGSEGGCCLLHLLGGSEDISVNDII